MKYFLFWSLFTLICNISTAQGIKYVTKNNDWDADSLGNHRVVLTLKNTGTRIAKATIEWRRNDLRPESKDLFVVDSTTNKRILNVSVASVNRESCTLYFEPVNLDAKYFVYYMPYKVDRKSNYPNAKYLKPEQTADAWLQSINNVQNIALASVESIEGERLVNAY